jgi:hypothetical protein
MACIDRRPRARRGAVRAVQRRLGTALMALLVASCELPPPWERHDPPDPCFQAEPERCFVSHGAYVMLTGAVAGDPACLDRAIERAMQYWAARPDALEEWLITYADHELACNGHPASGCACWHHGTLDLQALDVSCPETAQLVHELGHVVLYDPGHFDERWCWETEQEATREIVRAPDANVGCAASGYYTWGANLDRGCDGTSEPAP